MGLSLDLETLVDQLAELVAERVAVKVAARTRAAGRYYTSSDNPLGRRPFLEAARRGDFPSFARGKKVLALRADVDAWIEQGKPRRVAPLEPPAGVVEEPPAPREPPANDTRDDGLSDADRERLAAFAAAGYRPAAPPARGRRVR